MPSALNLVIGTQPGADYLDITRRSATEPPPAALHPLTFNAHPAYAFVAVEPDRPLLLRIAPATLHLPAALFLAAPESRMRLVRDSGKGLVAVVFGDNTDLITGRVSLAREDAAEINGSAFATFLWPTATELGAVLLHHAGQRWLGE